MNEGIIFNIKKEQSDGPVTVKVIFKGCPLDCEWCPVPETTLKGRSVYVDDSLCINCGKCAKECPGNAISFIDGVFVTNEDKCDLCGDCLMVCGTDARNITGVKLPVEKVMKSIEKTISGEKQRPVIEFSGGEPLMQPDFLKKLLDQCKEKELRTTVKTCAYTPTDPLLSISDITDTFIIDLKTIEEDKYKLYAETSNKIILNNIRDLSQIHRNIFLRMPFLEGINDNQHNIDGIINIIKSLRLRGLIVYPYKAIKSRTTKKRKTIDNSGALEEKMEALIEKFRNSGIFVKTEN